MQALGFRSRFTKWSCLPEDWLRLVLARVERLKLRSPRFQKGREEGVEFRRDQGYSFSLYYCNKCCICREEHPEFAFLMMQNGRMVSEEFPDIQVDEDHTRANVSATGLLEAQTYPETFDFYPTRIMGKAVGNGSNMLQN